VRIVNRVVLLVPILLVLACGASARETAIKTSLAVVDTARDGFVTWDRLHQEELFKGAASGDDARHLVLAYREKREPVLLAFEVAYKAIAHAAVLSDDHSLEIMLGVVIDLQAEVTKLGAVWPKHP
jgi:hypothetical protein